MQAPGCVLKSRKNSGTLNINSIQFYANPYCLMHSVHAECYGDSSQIVKYISSYSQRGDRWPVRKAILNSSILQQGFMVRAVHVGAMHSWSASRQLVLPGESGGGGRGFVQTQMSAVLGLHWWAVINLLLFVRISTEVTDPSALTAFIHAQVEVLHFLSWLSK